MRVFVSSSFQDLREHRSAAIRVLRQLGHEVLAMEDMTAGSVAPLGKVIEMVDRSEAYVGIFAWRYGYVPGAPMAPPPAGAPASLAVAGAVPGETSITHCEYLRAVERRLPVLAFLLDEAYPWPPQLIDGFDSSTPRARSSVDAIRDLRFTLQQERVVSWFTTPSDLEARVSAGITTAGLTRQLDLQPATALDSAAGTAGDTSVAVGITKAIRGAGDQRRALRIDIGSEWWSTRLYLIASLAERLTNVRRILVVRSGAIAPPPAAPPGGPIALAQPQRTEEFVGQISTGSIIGTIRSKAPALDNFEQRLRQRAMTFNVLDTEIKELLEEWREAFGDPAGGHANELAVKVNLSPELLRRWFGEAMLREAVRIGDLHRASVVDLLRLLDYPSDFVPVITRDQRGDSSTAEWVDVLDKAALNARLARNYLEELMDRARIS